MSRKQARWEREEAWLAVLLAWVAGFVDAVGFLVLFHIFVAQMSGNSAALGAYFGQRQWHLAFQHLFPIPVFVLGIALGAILNEMTHRQGFRPRFSVVLGLEAVLLFFFMIYGTRMTLDGSIRTESMWQIYLLTALPVLAMGLQNTTIRRIGGFRLHTTYVTGVLSSLAEEGIKYLYWLRDHSRGRTMSRVWRVLRVSPRQKSFNRAMLSGGVWGGYVIGAIAGSFARQRWDLGSLALPLAGLAIIIAVDLAQSFRTPRAPSPPA